MGSGRCSLPKNLCSDGGRPGTADPKVVLKESPGGSEDGRATANNGLTPFRQSLTPFRQGPQRAAA
jgi:hypothetical protein